MKRIAILSLAISLTTFIMLSKAYPDDKPPVEAAKPQTKCPVMGGDINKKIYVECQGKRIYLCCEGCIATVKKDPEKYIKELEGKGIILEQIKQADDKAAPKEKTEDKK